MSLSRKSNMYVFSVSSVAGGSLTKNPTCGFGRASSWTRSLAAAAAARSSGSLDRNSGVSTCANLTRRMPAANTPVSSFRMSHTSRVSPSTTRCTMLLRNTVAPVTSGTTCAGHNASPHNSTSA